MPLELQYNGSTFLSDVFREFSFGIVLGVEILNPHGSCQEDPPPFTAQNHSGREVLFLLGPWFSENGDSVIYFKWHFCLSVLRFFQKT